MERLEEANNLKRELHQLQQLEIERVNEEVSTSQMYRLKKLAAFQAKSSNYVKEKF